MNSDRRSTWGEEISLEYGKSLRGYADARGPIPVFGTNGQVGWTDEPIAPGPGIVLGRKGAYRGIKYSKHPFFVIDTAYYVKPKTDLHMRWLYYAMVYHQLGSIDDGSPIPSTTRAAVYVRKFDIPAPKKQAAIAKILGDLDDKIDLLREMNATLEEMAQAVFRAWFVDFDPVHAKAAGATSFRGMPQELFDELATQLEKAKDGKFHPQNWGPCLLGNLADVNPPRALKKGTLAPYVGMADVPVKGPSIENRAYREFTSGMRFQNGDTLLARITPCLENGKTALVDILAENEIGWGSTEFIILSPTDTVGPEFIYCLARDDAFRDYAIRNMTGTSGRQRVSSDAIARFPVFKAPDEYYKAFGEFASPLFSRISANRDQILVLSQLRDTLLPKLISGRIEVPELEALSDGG